MNRKCFLLVGLIIFALTACELEKVDYPPEPFIRAEPLIVTDTIDLLNNKVRLINLHFYLIDGDGDIGPETPCFNGERYLPGNCYLELYYKDGNEFVKDTIQQLDTLFCGQDTVMMKMTEWYMIPYAGDLGQDNSLKEDIYIDVEYNTEPQKSYSEFFYKITVFDMALNQSNTISTDTVIID